MTAATQNSFSDLPIYYPEIETQRLHAGALEEPILKNFTLKSYLTVSLYG